MKESTGQIFRNLQEIAKNIQSYVVIRLELVEKTKSILKTRLYFSEELFIQIYVNLKKSKRSYTLILSDRRIFGRDYIGGAWHLHPFENPDEHNQSELAKKVVTIEEFVEEAFFIVSEKLEIL